MTMPSRLISICSAAAFGWAIQFAAEAALADGSVAEVGIGQAIGDNLPRPIVGVAATPGPVLPFHVALDFRCPAGMARQQLYVSIADTAQVVEIPAGQPPPVTLRLDVPIAQLQWLDPPAAACAAVREHRRPDETDANGIGYFRLHPGTTGFVTLTCRSDDGREAAANSTAPLDVWLSCPAPAERSALR